MTSRRAVGADRRAITQLSAALLCCVLALTLTTLARSHAGQYHVARAKAVVGISAGDVQYVVGRFDLHAVADPASGGAGTHGVLGSVAHPVARLDARTTDTPRVRGPPGRAA